MTEKVAVSLEAELLDRVERSRGRTGESRSAFVRRALERLLDVEDRAAAVERYVAAYREHPERADEVQAALAQTQAAWSALEPGDDW